MIKRYISLNNLHLSTTVKVDNKEHSVIFKGGTLTPVRRNGIFITKDVKLQKAIESDNGYGKTFIEIKDNVQSKNREKSVKVASSFKSIKNIKNCQMAIEWIAQNLSIVLKNSASITEIINTVNQHGYDFPNLTKISKRDHDKK